MKCNIKPLALVFAFAFVFCIGCNNGTSSPDKQDQAHNHGHSHDNPPHGGTIADWGGGKYHVEFTVNHDKKEATVYILGDDVKSQLPVKADEISLAIIDPQFQATLKASPLDGETDGMSSRFVGNHESLGIVKEYEGKIMGTVDGTPYSGDFKEVAHDH